MAFIPQEDEDSQEEGMNVLGTSTQAAPQTQTTQPGQQDTQQVVSGQGQTIEGAPTVGSQTTPAPSQGRKKKGSGLFTDLRKYVQANQPAAQRLGQAVQQGVSQKAKGIQQQIQNQQKQFQQRLDQNQANLQQSKQFAQQAVQSAGTGQAPTPEDVQRFRSLSTGQQRFDKAGPLNLSQPSVRSQALQRLAGEAGRATGRDRLLRETFGDRQYTRGQQALDALVLGRSPAQQQLTQSVQEQAKSTQGQLRDARAKALAQRKNISQTGNQFREQLQSQLGGAREQVQGDIQSEVARRRQELQSQQQAFQDALSSGTLTREQALPFINQAELDKASKAFQDRKQQLNVLLGGESTADQRAQIGQDLLNQGVDIRRLSLHANPAQGLGVDFLSNLARYGQGSGLQELLGDESISSEGLSTLQPEKKELLRYGLQNLQQLGIDPNQLMSMMAQASPEEANRLAREAERGGYGTTGITREADRDRALSEYYSNVAQQAIPQFQEQFQGLQRSSEDIMQDFLNRANLGKRRDLGSFLSATDPTLLSEQNVVTDEQLARQNALAALAGRAGEGVQRIGEAPTSPGSFNVLEALKKLGGVGY
jgi:hypothetical protein